MMKEELPKISIIIPIYNVEQYLKNCLDSVVSQTYDNLEIILINDGSTDGSASIIDRYKSKDSRIVLLNQSNSGGSSSARNKGLDVATGTYICFIDSDDAIVLNYVEKLFNALVLYDGDICGCGYLKENRECLVDKNAGTVIYDNAELGEATFVDKKIGVVPWAKLFRRDLINDIRFILGRIHQDDLFCTEAYAKCKRFVKLNEPLYLYSVNQNGVTYGKVTPKIIDILPISLGRMRVVEKTWTDILYYVIYVSACSFIDIHVEYATRKLWLDESFKTKLFVDREEIYRYFVEHESIISDKIMRKINFYYNNAEKILLCDKLRVTRDSLLKKIRRLKNHNG